MNNFIVTAKVTREVVSLINAQFEGNKRTSLEDLDNVRYILNDLHTFLKLGAINFVNPKVDLYRMFGTTEVKQIVERVSQPKKEQDDEIIQAKLWDISIKGYGIGQLTELERDILSIASMTSSYTLFKKHCFDLIVEQFRGSN